jgi:uncharacterized membrane protein
VSQPSRHAAFIAYLLPVVGWLYVYLFHRDNEFAMYHMKQAMGLVVFAIVAPAIWLVIAWLLLWIPTAGALVAAATFTIVMVAVLAVIALWIVGMVYAARSKQQPLPIVGRWTRRFAG